MKLEAQVNVQMRVLGTPNVKLTAQENHMKTWCQYLSADICHMRCNALDSLPGRAFGRYDSDCSAGNSDLFATALLSHKDHVVSEFR